MKKVVSKSSWNILMKGFHLVKQLHVGGVAIGREDEKMTEISSKKEKKSELVSTDTHYHNNSFRTPDARLNWPKSPRWSRGP